MRLDRVEVLVLDEADQMLDLGFIHADPPDRRAAAAAERQTPVLLGHHAEGDRPPSPAQLLRDPAQVAVAPVATTVERVEQRVIFVETAAQARRC